MKAKIVLKSFPGHRGIPGHQGGSLPEGGREDPGKLSSSNISAGSISRAVEHASMLGDIQQEWTTERVKQADGKYADAPNVRFPKELMGKTKYAYRLKGNLAGRNVMTMLEQQGFSGSKMFNEDATWTHPASSVKVHILAGKEAGSGTYAHTVRWLWIEE